MIEATLLDGAAFASFAGIDVGENRLNLAIVTRGKASGAFRFERLAVEQALARKGALGPVLSERCPELLNKCLVMIDSPRWPLDLDWSQGGTRPRAAPPKRRNLDLAVVAYAHKKEIQLSLFPTPRLEYFEAWAKHPECKPHLRDIARDLFGGASHDKVRPAPGSKVKGGTFTRFMLGGFALYRGLQHLGVESYEAYPDLQFRLRAPYGTQISNKKSFNGVRQRLEINRTLRSLLGIPDLPPPESADDYDAEIIALSGAIAAREGGLVAFYCPAEGTFVAPSPPMT